jgi:hypothetical protein
LDAFVADAKTINFDIESMSGAELQTYFAGSSDPADVIERAKVIANQAGY